MWKHSVYGVQRFSFIKVNIVLDLCGLLVIADHSVSRLVSLICCNGDLTVILTSVHIVTGEGNLMITRFLCQVVWLWLVWESGHFYSVVFWWFLGKMLHCCLDIKNSHALWSCLSTRNFVILLWKTHCLVITVAVFIVYLWNEKMPTCFKCGNNLRCSSC